ncbi:MAG: flavodoxin family protein [Deltaproteobacteria bacterium]|jgi:multimeric flavodoxin WrbA|nr:flavodoxin family protein [Deltaproteobacteria bacterium]
MTSSGVEILGLHLSPRKNGSSWALLRSFLDGAESKGAKTSFLSVTALNIKGCHGCNACNETGICIIEDDDMGQIYKAWEGAKRIVISSPIFFYDMPSQGKAVLDRSQAFWSRRYVMGQNKEDIPGAKGFLLAVGATKGKELFTPISLAVKYLFDSIAFPKKFGMLAYRQIEGPKNLTPEQLAEVRQAGEDFAAP